MLSTEWYANNSDTQNDAPKQMRQANPNTTDENPDDIHQNIEATT
jgi:hypothetical protein